MKYILMSNNLGEAMVDDEDFERINKHTWRSNKIGINFYAVRQIDRKDALMHREVMQAPQNKLVDHINHNGLDNRKENLRLVNKRQNNINRLKQENKNGKKCLSKHKGVSPTQNKKRWRAYLTTNSKQINLGVYDTEDEAGSAYNRKAIELFGEYTFLNKI